MKPIATFILCAGALAGCSPPHIFEVPGEGADRATLTLYNETTAMQREGAWFVGRRRGADGSGQIDLYRSDGHRIVCPIGYVTNGDAEPHRFVIEDRRCRSA